MAVRRPFELTVQRTPLPPGVTLVLFTFTRTLTHGAIFNHLLARTRTLTATPSDPPTAPSHAAMVGIVPI